jgi:hypothetical protein
MLALLALLFALAGCRQDDEIKSYTVDRPQREKIRMLAALIPDPAEVWVFKLSGPDTVVADQRKSFDDFIDSIRFDDKSQPPMTWKAPPGWKEEARGGEFRTATFRIDGRPPLEVTVTRLPPMDAERQSDLLLRNINRWHGQLNLPPVEAAELEKTVTRKKVDGRQVILADMLGSGIFQPPVAQAPNPHGAGLPLGQGKLGKAKLPFMFEVPADWAPRKPLPAFSVAAYEVTDANRRATITISSAGGGVVDNVVRWRGQIELPPAKPAEIERDVKAVQVAGLDGHYVDLANPQSKLANNRILGVIVPTPDATWFIKMAGPDSLVGAQKTNFETFVKSFKRAAE